MASRNDLRIGTSGWSYPTGEGTWNGIFYPPHAKGASGKGKFDELAYYAERFDTVEINSTFYRTPAVNVTKSWAARTPKNFEFSLKLYQKFTHPKMFKEAALKRAPGAEGRELEALATINQSDVDEFKRAMDPLADAGKLGALLAQFPPSFKADTHSHRLSRLAAPRIPRSSRRRRAAPSHLERRPRHHAEAAERRESRVRADRRAEVPRVDPTRTSCRT